MIRLLLPVHRVPDANSGLGQNGPKKGSYIVSNQEQML